MEDIRLFPVSIGTRMMHEDLPEESDDKFWVRITASNGNWIDITLSWIRKRR